MRKFLLSFFVAVLFFVAANAQQGILVQSDTVTQVGPVSDSIITAIDYFTNKSGSPRKFTWVRDEQYLPQGWATTVCNADNCYSTTTSSETLMEADSNNQKTFIEVNFIVKTPGTAIVKITYFYPTDTTYAWFVGTATSTAGINNVAVVNDVITYPNPATNNLFVAYSASLRPNKIEIYNVLGQKVKSLVVTPGNMGKVSIPVSDLEKGLYFVRIYSTTSSGVITRQFTRE